MANLNGMINFFGLKIEQMVNFENAQSMTNTVNFSIRKESLHD